MLTFVCVESEVSSLGQRTRTRKRRLLLPRQRWTTKGGQGWPIENIQNGWQIYWTFYVTDYMPFGLIIIVHPRFSMPYGKIVDCWQRDNVMPPMPEEEYPIYQSASFRRLLCCCMCHHIIPMIISILGTIWAPMSLDQSWADPSVSRCQADHSHQPLSRLT